MFFQDHAIQYCNANLIHEYINHYLICNIYIFLHAISQKQPIL